MKKIALVHGSGNATGASNGGAGFVPGIPRLGLPDLNMADSSVGLTRNGARGRYSTLLPSTLGEAASWDGEVDYAYGALIGREARAEGYNVSLAGGMDLARDPRGRAHPIHGAAGVHARHGTGSSRAQGKAKSVTRRQIEVCQPTNVVDGVVDADAVRAGD
jgi:hypothetical protein